MDSTPNEPTELHPLRCKRCGRAIPKGSGTPYYTLTLPDGSEAVVHASCLESREVWK